MGKKRTSTSMRAYCEECHNGEWHWTQKNAVGVAAKHAQASGHQVHVEIVISVTYNSK
jgi:hypothetical protein